MPARLRGTSKNKITHTEVKDEQRHLLSQEKEISAKHSDFLRDGGLGSTSIPEIPVAPRWGRGAAGWEQLWKWV